MIKMLMFDIKESEKKILEGLDTSDFEITYYQESLNTDTKLTLKEYDETVILSVFINSKVSGDVLNKFRNLRAILVRSACYENIDIEFCRSRNIAVINAVDYGKVSASQFVVGLIFALTRNILCASADIKSGDCDYEKYESNEIDKLSLGVIGIGKIGAEVCRLAHRLGMKVYANDIVMNNEIKEIAEYVSFKDLLRKSDIVSLHIPYKKELRHLLSAKELEIMKDGSFIINTSNNELIDRIALYRSLKRGKIKGVALDIVLDKKREIFIDNEKPSYAELESEVITQKLFSLDNVIITPRIACDTKESLKQILISNFYDIKDFYIGRKTNRVV